MGSSYLAHCERALPGEESEPLRRALRSVMNGERLAARFAYSVEMDGERRWLQVNAARFEWDGDTRLIVANEDELIGYLPSNRRAAAGAEKDRSKKGNSP